MQRDISHSNEAIAHAAQEHEAQRTLEASIQAENAACGLLLVASRHCQLSVTSESTDVTFNHGQCSGGFFHVMSKVACFAPSAHGTARLSFPHGGSVWFGVCTDQFNVNFTDSLNHEQMYSLRDLDHDEELFSMDGYGSSLQELFSNPFSLFSLKWSVNNGETVQLRLSDSRDAMLHKFASAAEWSSTPLPEALAQCAQSGGLHLYFGSCGPRSHVTVQHNVWHEVRGCGWLCFNLRCLILMKCLCLCYLCGCTLPML